MGINREDIYSRKTTFGGIGEQILAQWLKDVKHCLLVDVAMSKDGKAPMVESAGKKYIAMAFFNMANFELYDLEQNHLFKLLDEAATPPKIVRPWEGKKEQSFRQPKLFEG
jgi:hypothetical protein